MPGNFHPFGNVVFSARVNCCGVQYAIALLVNNLMPGESFAENDITKIGNLYNENPINTNYYGGQIQSNFRIRNFWLQMG